MLLDLVRMLTLPALVLTGFALMDMHVNQRATYLRYIIGQWVTSALGIVSAAFLMNPVSKPWATLVCGLCIYTLVHTVEINGTSTAFKIALIIWSLLIWVAVGGSGLGWDTGLSLVLAVWFDYILAAYKQWLTGNPALAAYQGGREISAQERVKSIKVLKKAHKNGEISDFEYQLAKNNRTRAHHDHVGKLKAQYLKRVWGDARD